MRKIDQNILAGMAKAPNQTPEGVTMGAIRLGLIRAGVTQHTVDTIDAALPRLIESGLVVRNVVTGMSVEVRYQLAAS